MATWTATASTDRADVGSRAAVRWHALFVGLSIAHGALIVAAPSIAVVAIALWWNANTIAHNFIHRPFFRSRWANRAYSLYLSLLLGFPQRLWRDRHLAHHADRPIRVHATVQLGTEAAAVAALWIGLATLFPVAFLRIYLPGWAIGLALCQLHGYYEHARGTTSHYGRLYNLLFFNDGFHVEHHARPHAAWWTLPAPSGGEAVRSSRWPAVLRWLDACTLAGLERMVVSSTRLQRFVLSAHERAFRTLLTDPERVRRVTIVGGGLFPRTAIVLGRVTSHAELTIVDARADHLDTARQLLADRADGPRATFACDTFDPAVASDADLVVVPLAFEGDRRRVYESPAAPLVLVHDWIWNRRARSVVISWLLLKRLNLVERGSP
jgi:hypothetical protein